MDPLGTSNSDQNPGLATVIRRGPSFFDSLGTAKPQVDKAKSGGLTDNQKLSAAKSTLPSSWMAGETFTEAKFQLDTKLDQDEVSGTQWGRDFSVYDQAASLAVAQSQAVDDGVADAIADPLYDNLRVKRAGQAERQRFGEMSIEEKTPQMMSRARTQFVGDPSLIHTGQAFIAAYEQLDPKDRTNLTRDLVNGFDTQQITELTAGLEFKERKNVMAQYVTQAPDGRYVWNSEYMAKSMLPALKARLPEFEASVERDVNELFNELSSKGMPLPSRSSVELEIAKEIMGSADLGVREVRDETIVQFARDFHETEKDGSAKKMTAKEVAVEQRNHWVEDIQDAKSHAWGYNTRGEYLGFEVVNWNLDPEAEDQSKMTMVWPQERHQLEKLLGMITDGRLQIALSKEQTETERAKILESIRSGISTGRVPESTLFTVDIPTNSLDIGELERYYDSMANRDIGYVRRSKSDPSPDSGLSKTGQNNQPAARTVKLPTGGNIGVPVESESSDEADPKANPVQGQEQLEDLVDPPADPDATNRDRLEAIKKRKDLQGMILEPSNLGKGPMDRLRARFARSVIA